MECRPTENAARIVLEILYRFGDNMNVLHTAPTQPTISVVVPVYRSQDALQELGIIAVVYGL